MHMIMIENALFNLIDAGLIEDETAAVLGGGVATSIIDIFIRNW